MLEKIMGHNEEREGASDRGWWGQNRQEKLSHGRLLGLHL